MNVIFTLITKNSKQDKRINFVFKQTNTSLFQYNVRINKRIYYSNNHFSSIIFNNAQAWSNFPK